MIHKCLEDGRSIEKSKEHHSGFEKAKRHDECCFSLVSFLNAGVVPSDVKFGKESGFFHVIFELRDKRQRIGIVNGMGV